MRWKVLIESRPTRRSSRTRPEAGEPLSSTLGIREIHMRVGWASWSFESNSEWQVSDGEDCISLTLSDGGGAFQLSSGRKERGFVTPKDLNWCVEQLAGEWSTPEFVTFGQFSGVYVSSIHEGSYWRWWFLAGGPVLLRITYNAAPEFKVLELPQVETMLHSLRLENA